MSDHITSLSPAQLDSVPYYVEKWTQYGCSVEPADRASAEQALWPLLTKQASSWYNSSRRTAWSASPLKPARVKTSTMRGLHILAESEVDKILRSRVAPAVLHTLDRLLTFPIRARTRHIWGSVWTRLRILAGDDLDEDMWLSDITISAWGQHEVHRLACYDFLAGECGLADEIAPLQNLMILAQSCGGCWPRIGHCQFCERPQILHQDARWRLHCADGPALAFSDGFAIYAWHGVQVPREVIEQPLDGISVESIEREVNIEVRRVMIERYGVGNYLIDSGAQEIHRDRFGVLYRKEIPGDESLVMVKVIDTTPQPEGTYREYFLRVPPTMQTARQAVAWTFDIIPEDYDPKFES